VKFVNLAARKVISELQKKVNGDVDFGKEKLCVV
jgi:hypothetical protein